MDVHRDECEAAGVDPEKLKRLAARLSKCGKELKEMGLEVFGGAGAGSIRTMSENEGKGQLILADIDGNFDGGDGAARHDEDGLLRGEYF